jgi:hypothetical protein
MGKLKSVDELFGIPVKKPAFRPFCRSLTM